MSSRAQLLAACIRSRARLCLVVAVAFLLVLAPHRTHAAEERWWYLDGFGEIGAGSTDPPGEAGAPSVDAGPGTTWSLRLLPWVHLGLGVRLTTPAGDAGWGRYYILTLPVVLRLAIPLSSQGHELQLGSGIGVGQIWEQIYPDNIYVEERHSPSATTTAYEIFVGYVGSPYSNGLALLFQGGFRYEDNPWDPREEIVATQIKGRGFVRAGVSWG